MRTIGSQQSRDRKGAVRKQLVIGTSGNQVVAPSGVLRKESQGLWTVVETLLVIPAKAGIRKMVSSIEYRSN